MCVWTRIFFQDYFTYAKVFALIIIVVTGFVNLINGETRHFTWDNTETDISVIGGLIGPVGSEQKKISAIIRNQIKC
jgi:amino acid transporter